MPPLPWKIVDFHLVPFAASCFLVAQHTEIRLLKLCINLSTASVRLHKDHNCTRAPSRARLHPAVSISPKPKQPSIYLRSASEIRGAAIASANCRAGVPSFLREGGRRVCASRRSCRCITYRTSPSRALAPLRLGRRPGAASVQCGASRRPVCARSAAPSRARRARDSATRYAAAADDSAVHGPRRASPGGGWRAGGPLWRLPVAVCTCLVRPDPLCSARLCGGGGRRRTCVVPQRLTCVCFSRP